MPRKKVITIAGIRTSINLIDNVSNVLSRITGKTLEMKDGVANAQREMRKTTDFANKMSIAEQRLELVGAQYNHQAKVVKRLSDEYKRLVDLRGKDALATEKLKGKLLAAQMTELNLAEAIEKAGKAFEKQQQAEQSLGKGVENATIKQRMFNQEINAGVGSADNLARKIKTFVGAYLGFRGIKKGFEATIGAAAQLNQQAAVLQAAFGDANIGKHYFNQLQLYAIESRRDIEELTDVTRNFIQITRNTDKLMGLTNIAHRLALRTGNLGGAETLIQEAMAGRYTRLRRALHLTDSQIEPLKQAVMKGSLDGIIEAFNTALNTAGLTDDIVKAFQDSPLQKFYKSIDAFKQKLAGSGEAALQKFEPALDQLNNWLQSENAVVFFNVMGAGIGMIANGVVELKNTVGNTFGFIKANADTMIPAILGVVGGLAAWKSIQMGVAVATSIHKTAVTLYSIATGKATLAQKAFNLALAMNPITLVVTAILGLIVALVFFGNTTKSVRQIFSDAFGFIVDTAQGAVNAIVSSINWMIRQVNKVSNFFGGKQMQEIKYKADFSGFKTKGQDIIENLTIADLKARFGLDGTTNAINNLADQEAQWNAMQNDTLGSIDSNTKKITEEDLKWLRDVAEQEAINRFTTATLAPQLKVSFGDVRETADLAGIVPFLENVLAELLASTPEGVHS